MVEQDLPLVSYGFLTGFRGISDPAAPCTFNTGFRLTRSQVGRVGPLSATRFAKMKGEPNRASIRKLYLLVWFLCFQVSWFDQNVWYADVEYLADVDVSVDELSFHFELGAIMLIINMLKAWSSALICLFSLLESSLIYTKIFLFFPSPMCDSYRWPGVAEATRRKNSSKSFPRELRHTDTSKLSASFIFVYPDTFFEWIITKAWFVTATSQNINPVDGHIVLWKATCSGKKGKSWLYRAGSQRLPFYPLAHQVGRTTSTQPPNVPGRPVCRPRIRARPKICPLVLCRLKF